MSRYLIAAILVGVAVLLTLLVPQLRENSPSLIFVAAVALTGWLGGFPAGLLAVGLSALTLDYLFMTPIYSFQCSKDDAVRLGVFIGVAAITSYLTANRRDGVRSPAAILTSDKPKLMLPICAGCKRIRDGQAKWLEVEAFFRRHFQMEFTHGICQACRERLYPNLC
jgi:K+-sensing histidine kinase KdpD